MPERTLHPEWRAENEPTKYPFGRSSALTNGTDVLLEGTFLDAALYPVGGQVGQYLSQVIITHTTATLYVGDAEEPQRASGEFNLVSPPDLIRLTDTAGRPAGVLVSESQRLSIFQSWSVGTHTFLRAHTEFAASVVFPVPATGVRGIQLEDGSLFTDEVWMVGEDGVVLRRETVVAPGPCGQPAAPVEVIRVDVVGDPLFRRRLCEGEALFATPRFLQTITVDDGVQRVQCGPDDFGDFKFTVNNDLAEDTVLRVRPTRDGIVVEAVGSLLQGVR
jgi:hypothetical protein